MKDILPLSVIAVLIALGGCQEKLYTTPTFDVKPREFAIEINGFGEIEAAQAQRIVSPGTQPMTLAWLAPENSMVKAGDIIARFDAEQLLQDSGEEALRMALIEQDIQQSQASKTQLQSEIKSEQQFVDYEFEFADKFAIDDLRVYSRLEIIDSFQNRDFLGAKDSFLDWKEGSITKQSNSDLDVLAIRKKGHEVKYLRHQEALSKLQVYAPNDGLLTYEKDRRGEKPAVGQTIFPGRPIAKIPNLSEMQARVFVLARDAIDLAPSNPVEVTLDAYPERKFAAILKNISGYPRSIERGNPVTYYELVVALTEHEPELMQPGRKVTVAILAKPAQQALLVPLQAIHHERGRSFVYLKTSLGFDQQEVTTGNKNLYFVEIVSGLNKGDEIALSVPEQS